MHTKPTALLWAVLIIVLACPASADLVVTEVMSQSTHRDGTAMDWWELTNAGPSPLASLASATVTANIVNTGVLAAGTHTVELASSYYRDPLKV